MALQHTRLISKVFQSRIASLTRFSKRYESDDGTGGAPYRPWPSTKYTYAESADYWNNNGFKSQSEKADEYEKEEIYLHEIEERMRTYDKKYASSDRIKSLYNEFGWDPIDDRAFYTYGNSLGDGEQYGPGKKIDPSHYVTPEWSNVNRKTIPPIQYMTADQIRRSRGSYASVRELPPEQPSIWKYWNAYTCLGSFGVIMISKEFYVTGGHDMFEAIMLWGTMGTIAAIASDWFAWWHTLVQQESYDREYLVLLQKVNKYNDMLERYNNKPNEKKIIFQLQKYREALAEKVLNKTLNNKLGRIVQNTFKQLDDKISEELSVKKDADISWKRNALQQTVDSFDNDRIRNNFMDDALQQFCSGDNAKLTNDAKTVSFSTDVFRKQYEENYNNAKQNYLTDHRQKGSLNWVFVDKNEREQNYKSVSQKEQEYNDQVQEWASTRNPVTAPTPAFS